MSKIPEFEFNFDAVEGMAFEDGARELFQQLQDHYNKHIKPAPILFGGKPVARPTIRPVDVPEIDGNRFAEVAATASQESKDRIPVTDWEITHDSTLKSDVLNGVRFDTKVELFDVVRKHEGDLVIGDNGTYLLDQKGKK